MTPYEIEEHNLTPHGTEWHVLSQDDDGKMHVTIFIGPLAEERARAYQERMNEINNKHIAWPHE